MYCGDSSHFAAWCPRKLKVASVQVEVTPFRDSGKEMERKGSGVRKSSDQSNKDGNGAGHESPLSTIVKSRFGISQFSISSAEIKESLMESKHLVVKCSLKIGDRLIDTHALIDCGATGIAFVDKDFVRHHQLEEKEL